MVFTGIAFLATFLVAFWLGYKAGERDISLSFIASAALLRIFYAAWPIKKLKQCQLCLGVFSKKNIMGYTPKKDAICYQCFKENRAR